MQALIAGLTGLALSVMASGLHAQNLRTARPPAELPPASFKAAYYVDSRGCAFVRAGYGGATTWVPRVTRDRRVICGQTPTFAKAKTRTKTTTRVALAEPARTTTKPKTKVKTKTRTEVARVQPKAKTQTFNSWFTPKRKTTAKTVRVTTTQQVKVRETVKVAHATTSVVKTRQRTSRYAVRTTPQAEHPAGGFTTRRATTGATQITVTPRQVVIPKGYKNLLADKPNYGMSGVGTPEGRAQMELIWTQTMPRRLIDVTTGRDVTAQYPKLRYPDTTVVSTRNYATAALDTTRVTPKTKRVTRVRTTAPAKVKKTTPVRVKTPTRKKRKPVTDDAASPLNMESIEDVSASYDRPATGRFVQVATFGVPANATRTASKFRAAGLPVSKKLLRRGGKSYQIILLGPFAEASEISSALRKARGAGFRDAFTVK